MDLFSLLLKIYTNRINEHNVVNTLKDLIYLFDHTVPNVLMKAFVTGFYVHDYQHLGS